MKKDRNKKIKSVVSISVCLVFVIAGFTSPVIAAEVYDTFEFDNMQPYTTLNYMIAIQGAFPSRALSSHKAQGGVGVASLGAEPFLGEIGLFASNFAPRGWALCDGQLLSINQNQALYAILGTTYGGDGRTTFALPDFRGRVPVHVHDGTVQGLSERRLGARGGSETRECNCTCPTATVTPFNNMQPFITVNYIIALVGLFPSRALSSHKAQGGVGVASLQAESFLGEIRMFAGNFAPRGWAFCNGQLLPIAQNTALFSLLGVTYGGDGRVTFALPDLRGRVPIHAGSGPGLTPRQLGARGGFELGECNCTCGSDRTFNNMQPFVTVNYILALYGLYPSRALSSHKAQGGVGVASAGGDPYVAEITLFAGNFAPRSWAFCDGQLLAVSQNDALFSLLGTTYGGDGRTTFALPDLRGRVPVHAGTGPGLTTRRLGARGGIETLVCNCVCTCPTGASLFPDVLRILPLGVLAGALVVLRWRRKRSPAT